MNNIEIRAVKNGYVVSHNPNGGNTRYYNEGHHVFNHVEDLCSWIKMNLKFVNEKSEKSPMNMTPGYPDCCDHD